MNKRTRRIITIITTETWTIRWTSDPAGADVESEVVLHPVADYNKKEQIIESMPSPPTKPDPIDSDVNSFDFRFYSDAQPAPSSAVQKKLEESTIE